LVAKLNLYKGWFYIPIWADSKPALNWTSLGWEWSRYSLTKHVHYCW